jgi:hypothetical protein
MQKPYTPKCGQGKTKIDLFRDFLQIIPVKVSTLYTYFLFIFSLQ